MCHIIIEYHTKMDFDTINLYNNADQYYVLKLNVIVRSSISLRFLFFIFIYSVLQK